VASQVVLSSIELVSYGVAWYIVVLLAVDCNYSRVSALFTTVRALPDVIFSLELLLQIVI
jgi:hypothetical protein